MQRNKLISSVLTGLACIGGMVGTAQAVSLNPSGLGQVLIYPYYTVRGGNNTLISVVNTTGDAKAVKVRFLEGVNARDVLDFNLYLSAWDVWVAEIALVDNIPNLFVSDSSCTVPYLFEIKPLGQEFLTYDMNDGYGIDIERATEGHFEIIEMGTLLDRDRGSATAATHILSPHDPQGTNEARPFNCDQLLDAWITIDGVDGYWKDGDADEDIAAPTGGLYGGAAIIDIDEGTMFSYDAYAIEGFFSGNQPPLNLPVHALHSIPSSQIPHLNAGDEFTAYIPEYPEITYSRSVDAVSALFMHATTMNEFTFEAAANAHSEWVINFPTKRFYTDPEFATDIELGLEAPVAPFTQAITEACEEIVIENRMFAWDREAQFFIIDNRPIIIIPVPPPTITLFDLCWNTQVIRFGNSDGFTPGNDETEILGSLNVVNLVNLVVTSTYGHDFPGENGWARLDYTDNPARVLPSESGVTLAGLPVTGFWVERFANGKARGSIIARNYAGLFRHKGTRKVATQ